MKRAMILSKMALIALASVCLLAAPALSMPMGDGTCRFGHGAMFDLKNNLTTEEMDNMTLGELKEMQKEAMNQSQFCPAGDKNCSQNCRGPDSQMMGRDGQGGQMMGRSGPDDRMMGNDKQGGQMMGRGGAQSDQCQGAGPDDGAQKSMFRGNTAMLLMDDLNTEDLLNMTLKQIRDLIQTKIQELDNMTLSQIKQLKLEKTQMMENMTLSELKEERENRQEMAGILGLAAVRPQTPA